MMLSKDTLQKMYSQAFCLHPLESIAFKILLEACGGIPFIRQDQNRRRLSAHSYKPLIPEDAFPKISVSMASERWERDQESGVRRIRDNEYQPNFEDMIVRYIHFLIWKTMAWNSCHVLVGLGTLLYQYHPADIQAIAPDVVDNARRAKSQLIKLLQKRFVKLQISESRHGEKIVTRPPTDQEWEIVQRSREIFTPGWVPHQPSHSIIKLFGNNHLEFDWQRSHAIICPACDGLVILINAYNSTFSEGSKMKLNFSDDKHGVPNFDSSDLPNNRSTVDRFNAPELTEREVMLIQHSLKQNQNRRKKYRTGILRVYADGKEAGELNPRNNASLSLADLSSASYLQIFGEDREGELLLAVFLMPELELLQGERFQETIKLESGQKITIIVVPVIGEDEEIVAHARITYSESSVITLVGQLRQATTAVFAPLISSLSTILKKLIGNAASRKKGARSRKTAAPAHPWGWPAVAIIQSVIIITLFAMMYRYQQNALRLQTETALNAGFRETARFLELKNKAQTNELINAVEGIQLISLAEHEKTYPYLVWGYQPNTTGIAEGLHKFPDLEELHKQYLKQWSKIFLELGDVLVQTGKINEAIYIFQYLAEEKNDKALLYGLAELYKMDSRHQDAIAVYENMIEQGWAKQDPRPWHYAGYSYEESGDLDKAMKYYDQALSIFPGYAKVFYNKARLYLKLPGLSPQEKEPLYKENFQKALDLTLKAYENDDSNPRISFTLAILYADQQDWDNSLLYLERAILRNRINVVRAEKERAFGFFRNPLNEPEHSRFITLLDHYRPLLSKFNEELQGGFDPTIFWE